MLKQLALLIIRFYQRAISPYTPPSCRFYPTCSHYGYQSIERFGFFKGGWLALRRIGRCHPFSPSGFDPVPEEWPGMWTKLGVQPPSDADVAHDHNHEHEHEGHTHTPTHSVAKPRKKKKR
jgi:uncharacterized protein